MCTNNLPVFLSHLNFLHMERRVKGRWLQTFSNPCWISEQILFLGLRFMKHLALSSLKKIMDHYVPATGLPGGNIWECMHSSMENHSDLDEKEINSSFTKTTKRFFSAYW